MLQYQTIYPATLQLLKELQSLELLKECRLVGGTALALQLGHRRSVDLDIFGPVPQESDEIQDILRENHEVIIVKESKNIHIYLLDGVKVDIVIINTSGLTTRWPTMVFALPESRISQP